MKVPPAVAFGGRFFINSLLSFPRAVFCHSEQTSLFQTDTVIPSSFVIPSVARDPSLSLRVTWDVPNAARNLSFEELSVTNLFK